jgi:hypothetical protein
MILCCPLLLCWAGLQGRYLLLQMSDERDARLVVAFVLEPLSLAPGRSGKCGHARAFSVTQGCSAPGIIGFCLGLYGPALPLPVSRGSLGPPVVEPRILLSLSLSHLSLALTTLFKINLITPLPLTYIYTLEGPHDAGSCTEYSPPESIWSSPPVSCPSRPAAANMARKLNAAPGPLPPLALKRPAPVARGDSEIETACTRGPGDRAADGCPRQAGSGGGRGLVGCCGEGEAAEN